MTKSPEAPIPHAGRPPVADSRADSPEIENLFPETAPTSRILLVEDNEMNRDMLSRRLAKKGYSVTVALDGVQGIEMAVELRPDLILMDMSLPVMDGWEAVRRLRANGELSGIPIIALTAHAMSDDRGKAIEAGCDDYDTKPVEFSRLLQKMESLLRRPTLPTAFAAAEGTP
jgi:two-component system cell cycle response regulator DivK